MATTAQITQASIVATPRKTSAMLGTVFPAQDTIILGTDTMPGVWWLNPGAKEFGWQQQQGMWLTGATLLPTGDPLVECSFTVRFFNPADWAAFQPLRTKYLKKPVFNPATRATTALAIFHRELYALGVTAVVPKKTPFFTMVGKSLWLGQVDFIQYRPPKLAPEAPRNVYGVETGAQPSAADVVDEATRTNDAGIAGARG
jgi:hypothetical protein